MSLGTTCGVVKAELSLIPTERVFGLAHPERRFTRGTMDGNVIGLALSSWEGSIRRQRSPRGSAPSLPGKLITRGNRTRISSSTPPALRQPQRPRPWTVARPDLRLRRHAGRQLSTDRGGVRARDADASTGRGRPPAVPAEPRPAAAGADENCRAPYVGGAGRYLSVGGLETRPCARVPRHSHPGAQAPSRRGAVGGRLLQTARPDRGRTRGCGPA